jgi:hypothetical protein
MYYFKPLTSYEISMKYPSLDYEHIDNQIYRFFVYEAILDSD